MHPIRVEETSTDRTVILGNDHVASPDYLFSNDGAIPQYAFNHLDSKREGMSLHIGAGAMFSLMHLHNLHPYMVDRNPYVISMNRIIGRAIVGSNTVKEAHEQIITEGSKVIESLSLSYSSHRVPDIRLNLKADKTVQRTGALHWANHFSEVKDALIGRPPTYVHSDILDPSFTDFLQQEANTQGQISLFNATNIHSALGEQGNGMRFVADLPFTEDVTVLYSLRGAHRHFRVQRVPFYSLERRAINGIDNYISAIQKHLGFLSFKYSYGER